MEDTSALEDLRSLLRSHVGYSVLADIDRAATGSIDDLTAAYTRLAAKAGRSALAAADPRFDRWTVDDVARAVLLLARAETGRGAFAEAAVACYERGDSNEQRSWMRAVALLPEPERFLPTVIDACRTNILPLFEAIACENPFPARYFPERNFNQMVLKALFNAVALSRIAGLAGRQNVELARMAGDYASERRAAGRTVPADIGLAMRETP